MEVWSQGCRGNTLLHYAIWRGNLKMCKLLLRLGMDPYLKNSADFDAFTYAAYHRQYKMLLYLLTECKYPKNKPIQFFSPETEKLLREKLQESNGYDYVAEFHALMASEQLLGPRKGERIQALRAGSNDNLGFFRSSSSLGRLLPSSSVLLYTSSYNGQLFCHWYGMPSLPDVCHSWKDKCTFWWVYCPIRGNVSLCHPEMVFCAEDWCTLAIIGCLCLPAPCRSCFSIF